MSFLLPDFTVALPEIFLACAAMALLMLGVFQGDKATKEVSWLSVAALIFAGVLVVSRGMERRTGLEDMFIVDGFGMFMKLFVIAGAVVALIGAIRFNAREKTERFEFPILILLATIGMMMMISANDLISLYLGLELQSLSLYILTAYNRDDVRSTEAGLKYFVLGAVASGMLLYGSSMVYGFAGTTSFTSLAEVFGATDSGSIGIIIGIVFISAGLAFKVSAVPFHMWTPDVYEGAPSHVTSFLSVAPKIAAMALFTRILYDPFGHLVGEWRQIIATISLLSMVIGALGAISQRNFKRLMAYISIGHMGYALSSFAAGTEDGVRGVLIYMAMYVFMVGGTFAIILCMRRDGKPVEQIGDLSGLARTQPALAVALAIFMFSMAGIPPLAGFWSKFYVFYAAINANLYTLAIGGMMVSVVGAFYYIRVVKIMFFDEPVGAFDTPLGKELAGVIFVTALATVLFGIFPSPIISGAEAAAASFFAG